MDSFGANAQSVPNGNFESWTSTTFDNPQYYPNTSNSNSIFYFQTPANCVKTTDAYHGSFAVELTTYIHGTDTSAGYFVNTNPNGAPNTWHGGISYNQKPTGIRGYYKYNVATADSGTIIIAFSKAGSNIGTYMYQIGGVHNTYNLFNFTLTPALSVTPDSVTFAAISCKLGNGNNGPTGPAGSTLKLDSVSFRGVTSQPAQFNGDFELWQSQTFNSPNNWYHSQGGGGSDTSVIRTTDKYAGNYAVEMTTFLGDNNGTPIARSAMISTGYYPQNCNQCNELGGYAFTNQTDTLAFWYKYVPKGNDSAQVFLNFKKNGSMIWGSGMYLGASAIYKYAELPFNVTGQTPDTVIVNFQSSKWQDSALSYVGSVLKVDEVHFKSQPLNTAVPFLSFDNSISIYPNPSTGEFTIQSSLFNVQNVEVYNTIGEKVISKTLNSKLGTLNLNENGIYFVKINSNGKTFTKKIIVNK